MNNQIDTPDPMTDLLGQFNSEPSPTARGSTMTAPSHFRVAQTDPPVGPTDLDGDDRASGRLVGFPRRGGVGRTECCNAGPDVYWEPYAPSPTPPQIRHRALAERADLVAKCVTDLSETPGAGWPLTLIRSAALEAVTDLCKWAAPESLPELVYRLARFRLDTASPLADADKPKGSPPASPREAFAANARTRT